LNWALLAAGIVATALINVPFGYWRGYAKREGKRLEWILAIHIPVPAVVLFRRLAGTGYSLADIPLILLFVLAYFIGQRAGSTLESKVHSVAGSTTRCIYTGLRMLNRRRD